MSYNKHIDMSTFAALCLQVTLSPKLVSSSSVLSEQNTHKDSIGNAHTALLFVPDYFIWTDPVDTTVYSAA